jgi:sarcosine oxidase
VTRAELAPPSDAEFVVVGAGLLGLAAGCELARRGREVIVFERACVGHPGAGSKGECRIFRLGYDDPRYVRMAQLALPLWRQLEAETGTALLTTTGQLTFGPGADVLADALAEAGAPFERWPATEVGRQFPEVAAPDTGTAVYEPASGVINAARCLAVLRSRLEGRLHEGTDVRALHEDGGGVTVETSAGPVRAASVICCAGPRSSRLLATAGIHLDLRASLAQVAYFQPRGDAAAKVPIVVERGEQMFYALPTPETELLKVGRHHVGPPVAPETADLDPDPLADLSLAEPVARLLPGFRAQPLSSERCFYDNSPDEDFVLDRVGRVTFGAGTSGHGFKFGPLLGEVLADLAEGRSPAVATGWLGVDRPGLRLGPTETEPSTGG